MSTFLRRLKRLLSSGYQCKKLSLHVRVNFYHQESQLARPLIVLGDKTDHGGTVISADLTFDIHGKYVARFGDLTVCPKCKGTFPINGAADDLVDQAGNGYARHLDTTACGAKLISGQITTFWSNKSSTGDVEPVDADHLGDGAGSIAVNTESGICLECLLSAAAAGATTVVRG